MRKLRACCCSPRLGSDPGTMSGRPRILSEELVYGAGQALQPPMLVRLQEPQP